VALVDVQHSHIRRWVAQMHSGRRIALILSGWRGFMSVGRTGVVSNPTTGLRAASAGPPKTLGVEAVQLASYTGGNARWSTRRTPQKIWLAWSCGTAASRLLLRLRPSSGRAGGLDVRGSAVVWIDADAGRNMCWAKATSAALCRWVAPR
jgi:integrase/recombinase XerC